MNVYAADTYGCVIVPTHMAMQTHAYNICVYGQIHRMLSIVIQLLINELLLISPVLKNKGVLPA
jgi:hypothetical protein